MQLTTSAIEAAHALLRIRLQTASVVVDATAGNGGDTLFLAESSPPQARVYAFDIQEQALAETKRKTAAYSDKICYIADGHENFTQYVADPVDAAIFNLGYLPGGDHAVTTNAKSTLTAVRQMIEQLSVNGVLAIVAYPGHEAGQEEKQQLELLLAKLPKKKFTAGLYQLVNHDGAGPVLYLIEKVRR